MATTQALWISFVTKKTMMTTEKMIKCDVLHVPVGSMTLAEL